MAQRLYLAGPDVFLADARDIGRRKQEICREFGFEGLFPLDNDDTVGRDAASIFRANCALMQRADIGLFNLTPFRGPSADAGTVFELGYMFASGKAVHGYSSVSTAYRARVGPGLESLAAPRDGNGYAIENFGLTDNLMIVRAILEAGGELTSIEENAGAADSASLAAFRAFRACLEAVSARTDIARAEKRRPSRR